MASLKARLAKPYSEFIVAQAPEGLAGMAYASQSDPGFVMLHQLYILPEAQGQGLGAEMLGEIEAAFPDAKAIRLEVEAANDKAVRFYAREGFETVSRTENCGDGQSGIAALIMQKPRADISSERQCIPHLCPASGNISRTRRSGCRRR